MIKAEKMGKAYTQGEGKAEGMGTATLVHKAHTCAQQSPFQ